MNRLWLHSERSVVGIGLTAYLLAASAMVVTGRLNGDEGWYTLASLNAMRGLVPHRDFLFTQMPVLPYVYGTWLWLVDEHGLLAGRVLSLLFGAMALVLLAITLCRRGSVLAGALASMLWILNASVLYDVCTVRTHALTLLLSAVVLWSSTEEQARFGPQTMLLSAALLVCTRLSMLPVLPLTWVYVALGTRRSILARWLPLSAAVVALALWAPGAPANLRFGLLDFHRAWYGYPDWELSRFWELLASDWLTNQTIILIAAGAALTLVALRRSVSASFARALSTEARWLGLCAACYATTTLIHVLQPVAYAHYQTSNVLFAIAPIAWVLAQLAEESQALRRALPAVVLIGGVATLPLQRVVVHTNGDGGLGRLDEARAVVQRLVHGPDPIWTPSTELAVEAGVALLPHWEMGEFSWFADMPQAQAAALHVATFAELTLQLKAARPQLICLTARHAAMFHSAALAAAIREHYELAAVVPSYGYFLEPLYVFARRGNR